MKLGKLGAFCAAAIVAAATLTSCGNNANSTTGTTEAVTEAATEEATAAEDGKVYNIGILQLVQHDALDRATLGFKDAIIAAVGEENVNFDLQNAQGDSNTCATIANSFASNNYDLMMGNATAALQACASATKDIPVIGTSITSFPAALDYEDTADHATGFNVTGTNDLAPLDTQAEMTVSMFPDAENIAIIYCSAEVNSKYQAESIQPYFEEAGKNVTVYTFSDSNDLAAVMNKVVTENDVIFIPTDNTAASNTELIDSIARPAGIPIVAGEEGICKGCGVATVSIDFYDIGYRAGEMAVDILVNGADPAAMPVEDPASVEWKYNAEICDALGITVGDEFSPLETN